MLQSTSPSSLLLASLDVARKTMYFEGQKKLSSVIQMAKKARKKINQIPGVFAPDKAYFVNLGAKSFDQTKLLIKVSDLGITGFYAYKELSDDFHIQLELAETHLILAVLTIGTKQEDVDRLIEALGVMSERYYHIKNQALKQKIAYSYPETYARPRSAYHAPKKMVKMRQSLGEVAAESVMIYPPGIPIVIPGERITKEVLKNLAFYQRSGSVILSDTDRGYIKVIDMDRWIKAEEENEVD